MKPEVEKLILVRPGVDTDHNFIFATWLRGLYYGCAFYRQTEKQKFMEVYSRVVQNVLFKPGVELKIVCLKEDHDTIIGYSITEEVADLNILHWVFIKPEWRKCGVSKALIPETTNVVTHIVDSMLKIKREDKAKSDRYLSCYEVKLKNKKFRFDPFLI